MAAGEKFLEKAGYSYKAMPYRFGCGLAFLRGNRLKR
jgi:hypothetical protein